MTDQLPMVKELEQTIDYKETWNLYTKKTTTTNRVPRQFTIQPETDSWWKEFVTVHSGVEPTRGKGVSSALVELSMRIFMSVVADFQIEKIAAELSRALASPAVIENVKSNLIRLASLLEYPTE